MRLLLAHPQGMIGKDLGIHQMGDLLPRSPLDPQFPEAFLLSQWGRKGKTIQE